MGDKLKALVVEDEKNMNQAIRGRLEAEGFEVYCVHDGISAMIKAQSLKPDILILDLGLPGINGVTVYDNLRKLPETRDIAILFITGRTPKEIEDALGELHSD